MVVPSKRVGFEDGAITRLNSLTGEDGRGALGDIVSEICSREISADKREAIRTAVQKARERTGLPLSITQANALAKHVPLH